MTEEKNNKIEEINKEELWQSVLGELEVSISPANFKTWFSNTFILRFENNGETVVIGVPNVFTEQWLSQKYHKAILDAFQNITDNKINIIHSAVGGINENDISLAIASNAIIIGFNVRADLNAQQNAEKENVEIRYYDIIFKLKEDIIKALEGMLETIKTENVIGRGIVKAIFKISKVGTIAGCQILNGKVTRNSKVRLIRDKVVIYNGKLGSLKRFKDDASEVSAGLECGLSIKNYDDIKENDELEFYTIIEKKQTL